MQIRIIGTKTEIEETCKKLSEIFPQMIKSRLYLANNSGYRCYIYTTPIEENQHK